jgi:hypothetical protein
MTVNSAMTLSLSLLFFLLLGCACAFVAGLYRLTRGRREAGSRLMVASLGFAVVTRDPLDREEEGIRI